METFSVFTDGGARGNPGPAAAAAVLYNQSGELVESATQYLGETTNNMAEYEGLLLGLNLAFKHNVTHLKCHMDSELVVMQVNGAYRVKEPKLKAKWEEAKLLKSKFSEFKCVHVRREYNKEADLLVNVTLDNQ